MQFMSFSSHLNLLKGLLKDLLKNLVINPLINPEPEIASSHVEAI